MDKEDVVCMYACVHTHKHTGNGIPLSHKKEWNFAICNNMNGLGGYYAKWSKSEKDKYCMISLICGILKNKISEYNKTRKTHRYRALVVTSGEMEGGRGKIGVGN